VSDDFNTKGRILDAMKQLAMAGKVPKTLHVSRAFEVEMCLLEHTQVGTELARAILRDGPRKAIQDQGNTLFGLTIVWDAPESRIDAE